MATLEKSEKPKKVGRPKSSTKSKSKTTSGSKKGGNFLGAVGELVAPTGWESFATTAGLFAIDRADAALRRGKEKAAKEKKGGKKMSGGMFVYNASGNRVNHWGEPQSKKERLEGLYRSIRTLPRNSENSTRLSKQISILEEEIEQNRIRKEQKEANIRQIQSNQRFNEKTRDYVQDFITGIYLPGDPFDNSHEFDRDMEFRRALRKSLGLYDEAKLTKIIKDAKEARKNRERKFQFTRAQMQVKALPYNQKFAYRR